MTDPDYIIPKKIGEWELRAMFNEPNFHADLLKRTKQSVETYCKPAPVDAGQKPGAMSHIYDWFEYNADTDTTRLLATVHYYKNPDGSIGASGKIDPQLLVVGNTIFTDP
jgi:hypothetical protein